MFPSNNNIIGPVNMAFNQIVNYTYVGGTPTNGSTNYEWFIDAPINDNGGTTCGWQILSGQGSSYISVKTGCIASMAVVGLRSRNSCGYTTKYTYVNISQNGDGDNNGGNENGDSCAPTLRLAPNPIKQNDVIGVKIAYPVDPCNNSISYSKITSNQVSIYDFNGRCLYDKEYKKNDIEIYDVQLDKGNYALNVFTADGYYLQEIIFVE